MEAKTEGAIMTKRPVKKAKKPAHKPKPRTARELDDAVENVVDQMVVGTIADELKAGAVRRKPRK
jgi:hypothetical protein